MTSKSPNPFFPFDMSKFFDTFSTSNTDIQTMMDRQRKAVEAMVEANRTAAEGYQSLFTRQMELMQETLNALSTSMNEIMKHTNPSDAANAQLQVARKSLDHAYESMRELTEMANEANSNAVKVFQSHMGDAMKEWSTAMQNTPMAKAAQDFTNPDH
ncbi:MAG: phasin family protein [Alphaproteobacteria bacterium]